MSGVTAAKGGTLTFMVGGKEEGYERAVKILQNMGKSVIHTGPSGTGQVGIQYTLFQNGCHLNILLF